MSLRTLADGVHSVGAVATDAAGNTADDESTFTLVAVAADVTITAPADGSSTTDATPVVSGTTTPGGTVLVSVDGGPAVEVQANGLGYWTFDPDTLSCGQHTVTATAGTGADAVTVSSTFTVACAPAAGGLPVTGADPTGAVAWGLLLLVAGGLALRGARRHPDER